MTETELSEATLARIVSRVVASLNGVAQVAFYTPPQVAKLLGIEPEKVIAWIRRGELKAINVADRATGKRPRWRIAPAALAEFSASRQSSIVPPRGRRKRNQPADFKVFFSPSVAL